jgi:hypothetical protein
MKLKWFPWVSPDKFQINVCLLTHLQTPNSPLAQGEPEEEVQEAGLVSISLSTAYGKRFWFDIISKTIFSAVAAGIYLGFNMWLPICLELFTLHICDRLSPLGQPVTRVSRLLKDSQVDIQGRALATLALWILVVILLILFIGAAEGLKIEQQRAKTRSSIPPRRSVLPIDRIYALRIV